VRPCVRDLCLAQLKPLKRLDVLSLEGNTIASLDKLPVLEAGAYIGSHFRST